jgi:hypothetical protein
MSGGRRTGVSALDGERRRAAASDDLHLFTIHDYDLAIRESGGLQEKRGGRSTHRFGQRCMLVREIQLPVVGLPVGAVVRVAVRVGPILVGQEVRQRSVFV